MALQAPLQVFKRNAGLFGYLLEVSVLAGISPQQLRCLLSPVVEEGLAAEVGERFFGSADFVFYEDELVAEVDEKLAVAFALVEGEHQDA